MQIISKKYLLKKKEIKTNMVILWFLGARCEVVARQAVQGARAGEK